ncbi:probable galactinol--sucrose galactosyltransferase 2 [Cornus florida]|uniref:probable galactinol--sucrose galactosyltransferase 2 n=1 Tax=Cornus florida TaxID=4283 RepID=UPI0028A0A562|nr:probable galactinol--sucrose galactosyltransferase 2 [Cornus florida]
MTPLSKMFSTINTACCFERLTKLSSYYYLPNSKSNFFRALSSQFPHRICLAINCSSHKALHSLVGEVWSKTNSNSNSSRQAQMTVTAEPCVTDGCLTVNGKVVLTGVPSNVSVSSSPACGSAFLGATSPTSSSRHVFTLGVLQEFNFLSLFKFKIWWMIPRVGKLGSEIRMETQMLLLEAKEESAIHGENYSEPTAGSTFYILLLPVLDGQFRSSLQGTPSNELQFCVESGDAYVQTTQALEAVFISSGDNPYELIKNSIKTLAKHKGTFNHIEDKKIPPHLDWFGWCTWDAFYKDVDPQGIKEGLQSFSEGGCLPKFLIIDDGWQETVNEFCKEDEETVFATRLVDIKENSKFRGSGSNDSCIDLHDHVKFIKEKYGLRYVYVWHALVGYWGGLLPSSPAMNKYNPKIEYPIQSPGNVGNLRDVAMDSLEKYGVGLIDPQKVFDFYNDLHSYLAGSGIDGVKVDVQNLIETLGSGHVGRVQLTKQYQHALEESVVRNFKDNNLICCMSHNNDTIYSSMKSAVARASEDFMPREPTFQTLHVASVAFNSLLLGEVVVPDWDMFQSKHVTAEFHGAARAVGGCPVYVSDKPGTHDFKLLKRLALPDGSVLRARYAGRPTRDCLFTDPVMDGKSLLKIWNLNKLSGVIGVFNCQGAGNWPLKQGAEDVSHQASTGSLISGRVSPLDVEFLGEIGGDNWSGDCAIYAFNSGSLSRLPKEENLEVTLDTLQCEIFTISPVRVFNQNIHFAPIGLVDMYNSGGATEGLSCTLEPSGCKIKVKVRGCGRFGVYSSKKPNCCMVDMETKEFAYDAKDGLLTVKLEGGCNIREIEFLY